MESGKRASAYAEFESRF